MMKKFKAYLVQKAREVFRRKRDNAIRVVECVSDVPEHTKDLIYIIQRDGVQQWAILDWPCRSSYKITATLRKHGHPHWAATIKGRSVSLVPSLWFHEGCRSHFWIKNNHVDWV
jgi:Family of unknown function (DUF6527)